MTKHSVSYLEFFKKNLIIFIIICVATWLRVWDLENRGILFSDAGKDLVVAYNAVQEKSLPLLGIASSVPRFKQGPVSIWIEMAVISIFGINTLAQSLAFALISIAAVIGIYEFACIYIDKKHALLAAMMLATSPLAVASGRVPYHTTPLPLALVLYLFSLMLLWHKKKYGYFLAALAFCFLFQFELATAPLFLLIPFVMWRQKLGVSKNNLLQLGAGILVGLIPQIIFDLTHKFAQIGVFFLWIGHKVYEFVSFRDGGSVNYQNYFSSFATHGGRVFSTDYWIISVVLLLLVLYGFYVAALQLKKNAIKPAVMIVELSLLLLLIGYFIHGSPSEAYFPPFFILLPLHLAFTVFCLPILGRKIVIGLVVCLSLFNIFSITQHNFFVDTSKKFSYGASTGEINNIIDFVQMKSPNSYSLKTFSNLEEELPSLFDNYKWVALEHNGSLPQSGKTFYIEQKGPTPHTTTHLFRDFSVTRVYWLPPSPKLE